MSPQEYTGVTERLRALADPAYKEFQIGLIPGVENLLGVRIPTLRTLAKDLAKGDWQGYLAAARTDTYEETMLQGLVLGYVKAPAELLYEYLAVFLPKIDNWAVCDCVCAGLKFFGKNPARTIDFLTPYLTSPREYEARFGVVALMDYFVDEEHLTFLLERFAALSDREYYVMMAVAWAVSVCYVKLPERTLAWLTDCPLDKTTYNKALQKICESNRVTAQDKALMRTMKRK